MYKYVKKHTKELREYDENNYDFDMVNKEKEEKENELKEVFFCELCKRNINNSEISVKHHIKTKKHKINYYKAKLRYDKFVEKIEKNLKVRQPGVSKKFNKIIFFNNVYNFN